MKLVGLVSSFREGALVRGAIQTLAEASVDDLIVFEGPAGDVPLGVEEAPASELPPNTTEPGLLVRHGRWRSDGKKRNEILKAVKERHLVEGPLWGIWLDGDELLLNGRWLKDRLQSVLWSDEAERSVWEADVQGAEWMPTSHWPLRTVEADGSVAITTGRLVRLDLIRSYEISVSAITNVYGIEEGFGNILEDARWWLETWMQATEAGRMIAWPPLPGEPHIVHRANQRHPARRGLRMHHQEAEELRKAGKYDGPPKL